MADVLIDQPGRYDLPAHVYHRDPVKGGSLSSSTAKWLLPPSCPAVFKWRRDNQVTVHKNTFDIGHAAHALVLGVGEPIVVIDAADYKTKDARAQRDAAYADGKVPLLAAEWQQVNAMADALRAHPVAGNLFTPDTGVAEQTLVWQDSATGVWRRSMVDWIRTTGSRLIVIDYKSATPPAHPKVISRRLHEYGYASQARWYLDAVEALGLAPRDEAAFIFVFQEKEPPYLVTMVQPDPESLTWGARLNAKAIDTYAECVRTGRWPGYADDVISVGLPPYAIRQHEDALIAGDYDTTHERPIAS